MAGQACRVWRFDLVPITDHGQWTEQRLLSCLPRGSAVVARRSTSLFGHRVGKSSSCFDIVVALQEPACAAAAKRWFYYRGCPSRHFSTGKRVALPYRVMFKTVQRLAFRGTELQFLQGVQKEWGDVQPELGSFNTARCLLTPLGEGREECDDSVRVD